MKRTVSVTGSASVSAEPDCARMTCGVQVVVAGDVAWVSCDENLLTGEGSATVASLNLFARDDDGPWKMLAHHGAPVMSGPGDDSDD